MSPKNDFDPPVTGFVPSINGLRFANIWPDEALLVVGIPGLVQVGVGNARRGLCGGMVFTALDVFAAGFPPLTEGTPSPGSPLYRYLVKRLFDSFNLPTGVLDYFVWMLRPDRDLGRATIARGVAKRTTADTWPTVRADLDAGRPCPLGLVTRHSANPAKLGDNHQVLAYGYHQHDDRVTIKVYDPNTDTDAADHVRIWLDLRQVSPSPAITHNVNIDRPIRGFFRVRYRPADPSCLLAARAS